MSKAVEKLVADLFDEVTLQTLKGAYQLNKETLDNYYEGKSWLHRDDLEHVSLMIHHLKAVIEYFGGCVE
jgi:hypothetical protein